MLTLSEQTENRIIEAAKESGLSLQNFLDQLLERYQLDKLDIQQAEAALNEPGEISLDELKAKYGL